MGVSAFSRKKKLHFAAVVWERCLRVFVYMYVHILYIPISQRCCTGGSLDFLGPTPRKNFTSVGCASNCRSSQVNLQIKCLNA